MHRRIDLSSSRLDPSANGYIELNYSAQLHLALQRRCTAAADLTTRFNFGLCRNVHAQKRRIDYFDFVGTIGGPPATTSSIRLD
jgi:hypothetical protein